MAWIYLLLAGLFEITWATAMKWSEGLSQLWPTAFTILASIVSFVLLALAMKSLPLGTSYAIWTGIGVVGCTILGMVFFQEPASFLRLAFIGLIVIGIIGLKLTTPISAGS